MQCLHVMADRREHAPHLVVAAFVQDQPCATRVERFELGRQQRGLLVVEHQRAAREQRGFIAAQVIRQRRQVDLRQLRFRRDDPVQQLAVVGEQQHAGGVPIQSADRRQRRIPLAEPRRQQVEHDPPRILHRTGVADRLVQHQQQARGWIQRLAVDADVVVVERIVGIQHLAGGIGDAAFAEHPLHVLAAAVAQVGDVLDQLHRIAFVACTILKPAFCANVLTCAKPSPNACS